jgi:hypothetical protein
VLDVSTPQQAERLGHELGDVNVYVRGVLQALEPLARPQAVESIAVLLGDRGTLFAKELPPLASGYFAEPVQRHGLWPELERVMQLIPPGQITQQELATLFSPDRFDVIDAGAGLIHTRTRLPDGDSIRVPAIYALIRPRHTRNGVRRQQRIVGGGCPQRDRDRREDAAGPADRHGAPL